MSSFLFLEKEGEKLTRRESIEKKINMANLKKWEVASEIGISHVSLSVWLRELNDEREAKINKAIDNLSKKEGA